MLLISQENICVGALRPATLLKRDSNTGVFFLKLAKILRTPFFKEHHRMDVFVHIVHT